MRKNILFTVLVLTVIAVFAFAKLNTENKTVGVQIENEETDYELLANIPIGVNGWVVNDAEKNKTITTKEGIRNWNNLDDLIRVYFNVEHKTKLKFALKMKVSKGDSKIKVTFGNVSKELDFNNQVFNEIVVGEFLVESGYNYLEIQGLESKGENIADINNLLIYGVGANTIAYIPPENMYFGKRGPSVHMTYQLPPKKDALYFYNEVTVPKGEDVLGSFFMVNGHSEGYFGLQVNSAEERRILFSIWSPFKTDDPDQVPGDYQVTKLGSGIGVTVQNFGNEGTGLQSFKNIGWKAGVTYKFLTKVEPSEDQSTDYTGWYFDPAVGEWQLVASLRRPKTFKYLTRAHSFLENFYPSTGYITRMVEFNNQWVYTTRGQWLELTEGKFTADATATAKHRLDYTGGVRGNTFFLKNCGFFNERTDPYTNFLRTVNGSEPNIDFSKLEIPVITSR